MYLVSIYNKHIWLLLVVSQDVLGSLYWRIILNYLASF